MKIKHSNLGGLYFFFFSYLKNTIFLLLRISIFPVWVKFSRARPDPRKLGYEDLVKMRARYPSKSWQTTDNLQYQENYARRVANIAHLYGSRRILEVGCGHGLAAAILQQSGFEVSANDLVNTLDPNVQLAGVNIFEGDVCQGLGFSDGSFDLVFSVNAFEHINNPAAALDEILRVTRPGGLIYLAFDPFYYSPWGLHAGRRLGFPYPQIMFSEATIQRFVDEKANEIAQTYDPTSDHTRIGPTLNQLTVEEYRQIFHQRSALLEIILYNERIALDGLRMLVTHTGLIKAYTPTFQNLIISGINLLARKL